jgi:RNA polymerase sigma-70 factor (sigma-E family)
VSESFDEFYLASRDRLALQVAALTGDPTEAHDHVQEAFIRAWTHWQRISGYDDPEAWVRRVACNLAISRWRRARRVFVRADAGAELAQFSTEQLALFDALQRIPTRERESVVLHHLIGYSVEEIARALGAPSGTVKSWLSRGRAHLAEQLEATDDR